MKELIIDEEGNFFSFGLLFFWDGDDDVVDRVVVLF